MRFLPFPPTAFETACVSYLVHRTSASRCQVLGGEDIQVECHIERTQGQEVRRQSELLKGHRRGMTELPTRTSAEKSHLNRTDCYSFPVPSFQAPQAG